MRRQESSAASPSAGAVDDAPPADGPGPRNAGAAAAAETSATPWQGDAGSGSMSGSGPMGPPGSRPPAPPGGQEPGGDERPSLPHHRLLRRIGKGGFGEVWIGEHRDLDVFVAVKIIPASDPAKLEEELRGLRKLRQHVPFEGRRHLVWIDEVGRTEGALYCVMELADAAVRGPLKVDAYEALSLDHRLKQSRVDPEEARTIALDIAMGLAFLRAHGLEHGDLKPGNVLRVQDRWKLTDYSTLGSFDRRSRYGSRSWRPPPKSDAEVDQFALGVILHQLATARLPKGELSAEGWATDTKSLELRRICFRMMQADRTLQYPHLSDAVRDLERLGRSSTVVADGTPCPTCGAAVSPADEFCGNCSAALQTACPFCGLGNAVGRSYCGKCGGALTAWTQLQAEVREVERIVAADRDGEARDRLRAVVDPLLAEVVASAERSAPRGGRPPETTVGPTREKLRALRREIERRLALDEEIEEARASRDPDRFEHAAMRAARAEPNCRRFALATAESPRFREQVLWERTLEQLGHPHRVPRELSEASLRMAISRIRDHAAVDPEVRRHIGKVIDLLDGERKRRRRRSEHRRAKAHLDAGRPLEALVCLRRVEAEGAADERILAEIEQLAGSLRERWVPDLLRQGNELLAAKGHHRRVRRLARILRAIDPQGAGIATALSREWQARRRRWLVERFIVSAERGAEALDAITIAMQLDRAAAVAGRDPSLGAVLATAHARLDARCEEVQQQWSAGMAALARRRIREGVEALESAAAMAPRVPQLQEALGQARLLLQDLPRQRRRRLLLASGMLAVLAILAGAAVWQFWGWTRLEGAAAAARAEGGAAGRRSLAAAWSPQGADRWSQAIALNIGGDDLRRQWVEMWFDEHRAASPFTPAAAAGLEELATWAEQHPRHAAAIRGGFGRDLRSMLESPPDRPLADDPVSAIAAGRRSHEAVDRIVAAVSFEGGIDWNGWHRQFGQAARPAEIEGDPLDAGSGEAFGRAIAVLAAIEEAAASPALASHVAGLRDRYGRIVSEFEARAEAGVAERQRRLVERLDNGRWFAPEAPLAEEIAATLGAIGAYASLPGDRGEAWRRRQEEVAAVGKRLDALQRPRLEFSGGVMRFAEAHATPLEPEIFDPEIFEFLPVLDPGGAVPIMLVARTETTEAQRRIIAGEPVEGDPAEPWTDLTRAEAQAFCERLSGVLAAIEIGGVRWMAVLPSRAEWRLAAGEHRTPSWVDQRRKQAVDRHPGQRPAGPWHLHGNVREWGRDGLEAFGAAYSDQASRPRESETFDDPGTRFPRVGMRVFLVPVDAPVAPVPIR